MSKRRRATKGCGSSSSSSNSFTLESLAANNGAQIMWDHLGSREQSAWRLASRACRTNSDALITRIAKLVLGQEEPVPSGQPAPSQDQQLSIIKAFLQRTVVQSLGVEMADGGYSQLEQLLQGRCLPQAVQELKLSARKMRAWLPSSSLGTLLATATPNLVHLSLQRVEFSPGVIASLAACKKLQSLSIGKPAYIRRPDPDADPLLEDWAVGEVWHIDPDYEHAGPEKLWPGAVAPELSHLTQLTRLAGYSGIGWLPLVHLQGLSNLKHLELGFASNAWTASNAAALGNLTALEHLAMHHLPPQNYVAALAKLPQLCSLIADAELVELARAGVGKLSSLTSLECMMGDSGLAADVLPLPQLRRLVARRWGVDLASLHKLLRSCPNLEGLRWTSGNRLCLRSCQEAAAVQELVYVAERCAALGGLPPLCQWPSSKCHRLLMGSLQPLRSMQQPAVRFQGLNDSLDAGTLSSLLSAIPNLHSLAGVKLKKVCWPVVPRFRSLRSLSLSSSLTKEEVDHLASMQLTSLSFHCPAKGMQLPLPGAVKKSRPGFATLKVLALQGPQPQLTDLHNLLCAAPNLEKLKVEAASVQLPAPAACPEADTARTLGQVLERTCAPALRLGLWVAAKKCFAIDFGGHPFQDVAKLMLALAPISTVMEPKLEIKGLASFPPAAVTALSKALPPLTQVLKFHKCALDKAALLQLAQGLKHPRQLVITSCTGPTVLSVYMLQALMPDTSIEVTSCDWWKHHKPDYKQVVEDLALFKKA